jgi:hypothetical protein
LQRFSALSVPLAVSVLSRILQAFAA